MRAWLILALCVVSTTAIAKDPPSFDPAADPASLASTFLKVDKPKALAGLKTVAITNFRVEFAVENNGKAQSSSHVGATSVKADIKLLGVDDATRQAIADRLYDDFVADLTAAGIEVIPYETLAANQEYKSLGPRLKKSLEPVGTQIGKSVFIGPRDMPIYFSNDDKHLGLGAQLGSLSTVQPQNIEPLIAKSLNAAAMRVVMNVQFAEQKSSGGMFRMGSSVESAIRMAFFPTTTQVLIVTPGSGKSRITLDELVTLDAGMISLQDATKGKDKAAEAIGNVITGLATGITRQVRHYEATAEPQAYVDGITRYGSAYYKAVTHAIRTNAGS